VDVPDPYYGDERDFETCLAMIESGCAALVDHLAASPAIDR
jgi:protein-tyrosine-phosphatase